MNYFNSGHHVPLQRFHWNQSVVLCIIMQMGQADWIFYNKVRLTASEEKEGRDLRVGRGEKKQDNNERKITRQAKMGEEWRGEDVMTCLEWMERTVE